MILSTLIVAPNFGIGSSIFGHKILQNTGKEIVLFGKFEAVDIFFVSASLLLFASVSDCFPQLSLLPYHCCLLFWLASMGFFNLTDFNG